MKKLLLASVSVLLLGGCATAEIELPQGSAARGDPAKPVPAAMETRVTTDPQEREKRYARHRAGRRKPAGGRP